MKGCHDAEGHWDSMKSDHSGILKKRHGHCVCAVNPSICANDVSDSQMTRTSDGAPVLRPQPRGQCGDRLVAVCSVAPLLCCFQDRGCVHEVCTNAAHSAALCWALQPAPLTPSGLRQTLALELPSRHFLLSENRQQKRRLTHTDPSTRPSKHPSETGWVNASTVPGLQSGTEWNVSKAASPSKQSHIRTVLQSSPPLSLLFKIKATLELYSLKTVFMLVIQRHPLKKAKTS